ncbi:nuclear segregation protein [Niveomyces insectorum RCEF 264]|uniref:Nuclear segregation protein n=1 Tax=Niveomyces insectorum RCEF 264 TaxID=1081102 RepID=A0A167PI94_9HYPO|nr:nuclear segregation protein [Niveomyces insectorum RCEF 264]
MAETAAPTESAAPAAAAAAARPVKPDEAEFQKALEKAEKEHKDVMARFNAVKAKIELAQPKGKDGAPSPVQKQRQELIAQLNEIRKKQAGGKSSRTSKQEQIKRLDEQLRSRISEQKAARGKVPFKSAEDLDRHLQRLEDQVNGGMMKLVDEKKALAEITNLKKVRKTFAQFDGQEQQIAEVRAQIKQIKDSLDDPAAKALSERYNALQAQLDALKAEQDGVYQNLSSLRDERSRLHAEQRTTFDAIRKLKDTYYSQKKAFAAHEREARAKAWERKQAERERIERERRKERAQRLLAEASDPAYLDEIRRARSLLHFFDPTSPLPPPAATTTGGAAGAAAAAAAGKTATNGSNGTLSAQATRKVDDAGLKGMRLVRKEDRDDDYLPAAKKSGGKKNKKNNNNHNGEAAGSTGTTTSSKGFNVPPSVIEDCASMGLNPPASAADVADVVEKIKAKLAHWEADQTAQTQRNVEKAKKEIEKLEKEEEAQEAAGANGTASDKKKPAAAAVAADDKDVAEATTALKDASLEETKGAEKTTDATTKEANEEVKA